MSRRVTVEPILARVDQRGHCGCRIAGGERFLLVSFWTGDIVTGALNLCDTCWRAVGRSASPAIQ